MGNGERGGEKVVTGRPANKKRRSSQRTALACVEHGIDVIYIETTRITGPSLADPPNRCWAATGLRRRISLMVLERIVARSSRGPMRGPSIDEWSLQDSLLLICSEPFLPTDTWPAGSSCCP